MMRIYSASVLLAVLLPLASTFPLGFGGYPFDLDYGTDIYDTGAVGPLCGGARIQRTWPCDRYCDLPVLDYPCGLYPGAYGGNGGYGGFGGYGGIGGGYGGIGGLGGYGGYASYGGYGGYGGYGIGLGVGPAVVEESVITTEVGLGYPYGLNRIPYRGLLPAGIPLLKK